MVSVVGFTYNTLVSAPVSAITITTASTASVNLGAALSITMAATGGSGAITFTFDAADTSIYTRTGDVISWANDNAQAAGNYLLTITATDAAGTIATKQVTITVNAGATSVGAVTGLALASTTPTTLVLSFTDATGADYHQVAIDGDMSKARTLGVSKTVGISRPGASYSVQVRGSTNAGIKGPWCTAVIMTAQALSAAGPSPVTQAIRAHKVTDAHCLQLNLNYTATSMPNYYYGNSTGTLTNGTFQAGGWVKDHVEPLANVGLRNWRGIPAGHNSKSSVGATVARGLFANYGIKLHATLNYNTYDTTPATVVLNNIADPTKGNFASAIASVAGLNEPNGQTYPAGVTWQDETIATTLEIYNAVQVAAYSGVEVHCFSPWGRRGMDALISYTDAQGRTWQSHCASKISKLNLHYYTGGRRPEIAGAPTGANENGIDLDEVSIDWTRDSYQVLAPTGTTLPFVMTESGWGRQPCTAGLQYVSMNTSRKNQQRLTFENLRRNCDLTAWFQFFQTDTTMSWQMVDYTISGGTCTFTRTGLYTIMLNTLTAFYDSGATARTFTPGSLAFTLGDGTGSPGDYDQQIHHLLTQKSNGQFFLAIWYEKDSWDKPSKSETFGSRNIKLTLPGAMAVATNRPYTNTTFTAVGTVSSTDLTVNDDVLVVRIG